MVITTEFNSDSVTRTRTKKGCQWKKIFLHRKTVLEDLSNGKCLRADTRQGGATVPFLFGFFDTFYSRKGISLLQRVLGSITRQCRAFWGEPERNNLPTPESARQYYNALPEVVSNAMK